MTKKWLGPAPSHCDACNTELKEQFYDARAKDGTNRWGNFCPDCFKYYTFGKLGVGFGQHYKRVTTEHGDRWEKVA